MIGILGKSKKVYNYLKNDDSVWSFLANIILAFLIIRFIVYPVLGIILGTSFPIVAVVSESMEHGQFNGQLCGEPYTAPESFNNFWDVCGKWYNDQEITKSQFQNFPFKNGFNKGDVIILWRANKLELGDVLVFQGLTPQPIIHRIVKIYDDGDVQTKGDHNSRSISGLLGEEKISSERVLGKGLIRIPYLGWLKILFVDAVQPLGINIQR